MIEPKQQLKLVIAATYKYYTGGQIDNTVLSMMADDLDDQPLELVLRAYSDWRRNPKNNHFPRPGQIIGMINPSLNDDDQAREIASVLLGCVVKCGWNNPEDARERAGEVAWRIVRRMGGWVEFCRMANENSDTTMQAQVRDQLVTELKREQGATHALSQLNPAALPSIEEASNILKMIESKRNGVAG